MIDSIINGFDIWTDAQGVKSRGRVKSIDNISLEGIARLREVILDLAIRGKLVSQIEKDEPASSILESIKLKYFTNTGAVFSEYSEIKQELSDDIFELPKNWCWAYLPNVCKYRTGKTPSTKNPYFWSDNTDGYPWVSISDMVDNGKVTKTEKRISEAAKTKVFIDEPSATGTILMSFKLTIGKISILDIDSYHNEAILSIYPYEGILKEFIFRFLPIRAKQGKSKNALMGNTLNAKSLAQITIPIPPKNEQKRIIDKVNELMSVCDKLEEQQTSNLATHHLLVKSLLETLTQANDADELQSAWEKLSKHFDTLFCTEDSIEQLKQTILQLAITGKLVKQDLKDEHASELLKKIVEEKNRLIDEKFIRKEKLDLSEEEIIQRELPSNWIQVFLQEITSVITCGLASTPDYKSEGRMFLSAKNVKPFKFMPEDFQYVDELTYQKITSWGAKPEKGDILLTRVGAGIGESAIIDRDIEFAYYVSLTLVKPIKPYINSDYLLFWLNSPEGVKKSLDSTFGKAVSAGNLNVKQVRKFIVPLPPLEEQNRIVERVYQLFSICDQIKDKISHLERTKVNLSNAVMQLS